MKNKLVNIICFSIVLLILGATITIILVSKNKKNSDNYTWNSNLSHPEEILTFNGNEYKYNGATRNFLLVGVDTVEQLDENYLYRHGGQADVIFLVSINYLTNTKKVLQLNRDTITDIDEYSLTGEYIGTKKEQLALAYAYGTGGLDSVLNIAKAVSKLLLNIEIDSYYVLNMNALVGIIDSIDGIDITFSESLNELGEEYIEGNTKSLTGTEALRYVRARMNVSDGTNLSRMKRHREFIVALVDKIKLKYNENSSNIEDMYNNMKGDFISNLTFKTTMELFNEYNEINLSDIITIDGVSNYENTYTEFYPDETSVLEVVINMFYSLKE